MRYRLTTPLELVEKVHAHLNYLRELGSLTHLVKALAD